MNRGDIWWVDLPTPTASEPGYSRPVLIIQSDDFNRSAIQTIIAVALTSNLHLALAPGNVLLPSKTTGLSKDSVANVSQVVTLDKQFLRDRAGTVPRHLLKEIEAGIRLVLGL